MEDKGQVSRRDVLAATAAVTVGAGTAMVAGAPAQAAAPGTVDGGFSTMATVNFTTWGTIFLAPGGVTTWWFTWYFSSERWNRFSAMPTVDSPAGSSVEIVAEWANNGVLNVQFRNNSSVGVVFRPSAIVVPA